MTVTLENIPATESGKISKKGIEEFLFEIRLDDGVFTTLRRGIGDEEGAIIESGYKISEGTQTGSGIVYGKEHLPFHASARYHELDEFLREYEERK